jgi:DNA-binding response OmpR family regulator
VRNTILVVEDDADIRELTSQFLLTNGYSVFTASDGVPALKLIRQKRPDLVIVDLGLPKLSGESLCIEIKKNYPEIPIIILTAKAGVSDVVEGFRIGAEDYVTKPFDLDVLLARVQARLRKRVNTDPELKVGDLEMNLKNFEVKREGKSITLSHKEFELLEYLMANKGQVLTRDMILQKIWLSSDYIEPKVVDVYIGYLRKKIDHGFKNKLIRTVRGFGYMIKEVEA